MQNIRRHPFPANDCVVVTGLCPNGDFGAFIDGDERNIRGYGHSRFSAIADLVEALSKTEADEDQMFSEAAE